MTQEDLAKRVGVTQPTVSDWENGISLPNFRNATRLAKVLGITLAELLGEEAA